MVRDRSANAFAIGGGVVYVHDGTIAAARNEAEVAAVLAHEMGHELAGHFCGDTSWAGLLGDLFAAGPSDGRGIGSMRQTIDPAREHAADRLSLRSSRQRATIPAPRSTSRAAAGADRRAATIFSPSCGTFRVAARSISIARPSTPSAASCAASRAADRHGGQRMPYSLSFRWSCIRDSPSDPAGA